MKNPRIRTDGYAKDIVYSLEIDRIRANSAQPRRDFDIESIVKLADSIRRYGILQPLSVRRIPKSEAPAPPEAEAHQKKNIVADLLFATLSEEGDAVQRTDVLEMQTGAVSRETFPLAAKNGTHPSISCKTTVFPEKDANDLHVSRETTPFPAKAAADTHLSRETPPLQLSIADEMISVSQLTFGESSRFPISNQAATQAPPIDDFQYELVAGERRLRAAKMLGMRHVPCIIVDVDDAISAELALVENMLRENLNMFEQAAAFAHLAEKYALTQEEIAAKLSLSQSAVANKIRLLKLTEEERRLVMESGLTERHARAFLRISDPLLRENCIHRVISARLNVNETDKYIANLLAEPSETQTQAKEAQAHSSPEKLCSNIYKFINRLQGSSGNLLAVNRRSDGKNVIITLTVRKGS